ncbi:hypothetical protein DFH28DRAFT_980781 [Melampsora americana]|nr:hypothetical protein DFH28DRAFT_980781 [Melampsora americana]
MQITSFNTIFFTLYILVTASLVYGQGGTTNTKPVSPDQRADGLKTANNVLNSVSTGLGRGGAAGSSNIVKSVADGVGQIKTRRSIKVEREH